MVNEYKYLIFTCIKENVVVVKEELCLLLSSITKFPINWKITHPILNTKKIYFPTPPEGGRHYMDLIIWEPLNNIGTTIFFVNYLDGWNSLIELYSKKFNRTCVQVGISDYDLLFPMYKFSYYQGLKKRVILSYKDDKAWKFIQEGDILSFEEIEFYKKRNIKDRLPNSLIIKYLYIIGWDISSKEFWETNNTVYNFTRVNWDNDTP